MAPIKIKNKIKTSTYITTTLLFILSGCEDGLKKDQAMVCKLASKDGLTAEKLLQDFYPVSAPGKELKRTLQESHAPASRITSELDEKLLSLTESPHACPAFEAFSVRVKRAEELAATVRICGEMKTSLDELARVLPPMFEAEIHGLIEDTIPEQKREDVSRIFKQELQVKQKMLAQTGDPDYEALRQEILVMSGCPTQDAPPAGADGAKQARTFPPGHEACAEIQQALPGLTRNRRVILIGEAYGEALMQSGLDPSQYTEPLQQRLLTLAKQDAIRALEPHVKKLGEQTKCQFR